MAHKEQQEFCNSIKELKPQFFSGIFALDIGALDINGNNRVLFDDSNYLGLDVALGRNVDIVSKGHELGLPDNTFDTIISTECFEHDQYYPETLKNIYRMLKPGGLFLFTCATTGRPEHGTRRTTPEDAPLLQGFTEWSDYYKNLTEEDIREVFGDIDTLFEKYEFSIQPKTCDLRFWGVKRGPYQMRNDYSFMMYKDGYKKNLEKINNNLQQISTQFLDERNNALEEVKLIKSEIDGLKQSTSWRITSPIRVIKTQLRRFFQCNRIEKVSTLVKLLVENPRLILKAFSYFRKNGFKQTITRLRTAGTTHNLSEKAWFDIRKQDKVYILTTLHCNYIADLLTINLKKLGIEGEVIYSKPKEGYSSNLHFVICPQIFSELPDLYVAYQMEQSVNSRWFNESYFGILNGAYRVFDYSETNLAYLESHGFSLKAINYMPITHNLQPLSMEPANYEYDVIFYGDVNNDRRRDYINSLKSKFSVKVVNNLFGEELISELQKAKVVVNIHYYEGALLETTRIYECLSNNLIIVSEKSSDQNEHSNLNEVVDFVSIGNIEEMMSRVDYWLNVPEDLFREKVEYNNKLLAKQPNWFEFFFMRFMLENDWITFDEFYEKAGKNITFSSPLVCLGLPESAARKNDFEKDNKYSFEYFPGLKHQLGWVGCGLSYKFILKKAKEQGFDTITVCEDDVEFPPNFQERYKQAQEYLAKIEGWDLYSGLIADLNKDTVISNIDNFKDEEYLHVNKMTSTVLNIYPCSFYDTMISWDNNKHCSENNTIDRYIESTIELKVITTNNFLVHHKEELYSTLWGFDNSTYNDMIERSERELGKLKEEYKASHQVNIIS